MRARVPAESGAIGSLAPVGQLVERSGGLDRVVPVGVPVVRCDWYGCEFGVGDFLAERVVTGVEVGLDLQTGAGGGGGDELDDGAVGSERLASPVHGDEGEEAVLDFVPLRGARRH